MDTILLFLGNYSRLFFNNKMKYYDNKTTYRKSKKTL